MLFAGNGEIPLKPKGKLEWGAPPRDF